MRSRVLPWLALVGLGLAVMGAPPAHADAFTFQGVLETGTAPLNGSADLEFRMFDAAVGGSQLGNSITQSAYPVVDGLLTIDLDFGLALVFNGAPRFLEITVDGLRLEPRIEVLPTPLSGSTLSLRGQPLDGTPPAVGHVLRWNGLSWGPEAPAVGTSYSADSGLQLNGSTFSIAPSYRLPQACASGRVAKWNGTAWACATDDGGQSYLAGTGLQLTGATFGVNFAGNGSADTVARSDHDHLGASWTASTPGPLLQLENGNTTPAAAALHALGGRVAVLAESSGFGPALEGITVEAGIGLRGIVRNTTPGGGGAGVAGTNERTGGLGVHGLALGESGFGVRGHASAPTGSGIGVIGVSDADGGAGVLGENASSGGGAGVLGRVSATAAVGVLAEHQSTSGVSTALYATQKSPGGAAIQGAAMATTGASIGVAGTSSADQGTGVRGDGVLTGVHGVATDAVNGVALRGEGGAGGLSAQGAEVGGVLRGGSFGVVAEASGGGGQGVRGAGAAVGVFGLASSTTGEASGVRGDSAAPGGFGLQGNNTATTGEAVGVRGQTQSSAGVAVRGVAAHPTGSTVGVQGEAVSEFGTGVSGRNTATTGAAIGVRGTTQSNAGIAIYGTADGGPAGSATALRGDTSAPLGFGVQGVNAAVAGDAIGVYGESRSSNGVGVNGFASDTSGSVVGVLGESVSELGVGVSGSNLSATGPAVGVYGQTQSIEGIGVYGAASGGPTGNAIGVRGETAAPFGLGLFATNTATSGPATALDAVSSADGGTAATVRSLGAGSARALDALSSGTASGANALRARLTDAGSLGDAIYAYSNATGGGAGRFENAGGAVIALAKNGSAFEATGNASLLGDMAVVGTLSKGGGSFKIDHPLDPEGHYLYHSFVESPDMMNLYNGNVVTDAQGVAVVELPEWFEALNRDFRYQLTVIGSFAQAMVAEEVRDNRFTLRTSAPHTKVSWQVTGIRHDPWAEANRIPVTEPKRGPERGKYLHPQAWGQPASKGLPGQDRGRQP